MSHPVAARSVRVVIRGGPALLVVLAMMATGCTPLKEWVHNGFKVGPNFEEPLATVATDWIDATQRRSRIPSTLKVSHVRIIT
jgi:hypothetical protein